MHPQLTVVLNGGVAGVEQVPAHLQHVDGVMMGRAAYQEPWRLIAVDPLVFGADAPFGSPNRQPPISAILAAQLLHATAAIAGDEWTGRRAVKHNTAVIEPSVGCAAWPPGGATARRRDGDRTEAARVLGTFSRRRVAATEDVLNAICPAAYARNRHRRSS